MRMRLHDDVNSIRLTNGYFLEYCSPVCTDWAMDSRFLSCFETRILGAYK